MAAVNSRLFGQARMQLKQPVHAPAASTIEAASGRFLNFLLFGEISIATRTATSPTFSGSRMAAPASLPSTRDRTISSGSSPVLSGSPWRFLALVTMRGAWVFTASRRTSARMHCSSTTMTSAIPDLMNLSWWERAPTIRAPALYRVRSRAVQQIPADLDLILEPHLMHGIGDGYGGRDVVADDEDDRLPRVHASRPALDEGCLRIPLGEGVGGDLGDVGALHGDMVDHPGMEDLRFQVEGIPLLAGVAAGEELGDLLLAGTRATSSRSPRIFGLIPVTSLA